MNTITVADSLADYKTDQVAWGRSPETAPLTPGQACAPAEGLTRALRGIDGASA